MAENNNEFINNFSIDELSATPKYQQLVDAVINEIKIERLKISDMMPSINELSFSADISRLTVEKGYNELRKIGVLEAFQGKGYFIKSVDIKQDFRIFLLFNKLSAHKKILYDAFVKTLGDKASIDFYVYNNDAKLFCKLLETRKQNYSHYVIIPHFVEGEKTAIQAINNLPKDKLILLDKFIPEINGKFGAVYENFSKDIFNALTELKTQLQKYKVIKLIFPENSYFPAEILEGFKSFCQSFVFEYKVVLNIGNEKIEAGDIFINLMEDDLFDLLEKIETSNLNLGEDIGIISYNETKSKKYIMNGLTTLSTNFEMMGKKTAELVLNNSQERIEIPFSITVRQSI
jgi:DNA-binding transcriptional regulator YhcF (GntR family)